MKIYLASFGKLFGPFTDQEIDQFTVTGEIKKYHYIWRSTQQIWKSLDAAPTVSPEEWTSKKVIDLPFKNILIYNDAQIVSGSMGQFTESGFWFTTGKSATQKRFVEKSRVQVSLLEGNETTHREAAAFVSQVKWTDQGWSYLLRWKDAA